MLKVYASYIKYFLALLPEISLPQSTKTPIRSKCSEELKWVIRSLQYSLEGKPNIRNISRGIRLHKLTPEQRFSLPIERRPLLPSTVTIDWALRFLERASVRCGRPAVVAQGHVKMCTGCEATHPLWKTSAVQAVSADGLWRKREFASGLANPILEFSSYSINSDTGVIQERRACTHAHVCAHGCPRLLVAPWSNGAHLKKEARRLIDK